jgi:hypothetical protein
MDPALTRTLGGVLVLANVAARHRAAFSQSQKGCTKLPQCYCNCTEAQFEKREIVGLRTNGTSRIWPNSHFTQQAPLQSFF